MAREPEKIMEGESNERTPLITTVIVAPPRRRYPRGLIRRLCTIASCTLISGCIIFLLLVALLPGENGFEIPSLLIRQKTLSSAELETLLMETTHRERIRENSLYYTSGPHLAGKNYSQALWTQTKWQQSGIKSEIVSYDVYINYPLGHRLALYERDSEPAIDNVSDLDVWKVKFEASLEEDVLEEDPTTALENRIPTFHGYSASGNVTAPYVYVNYGTYQDFEELRELNVNLEGKIAIARYGGIFRGLKVKRAQDLGMVGVVIFTDPGDDEEEVGEDPETLYPKGPGRNPSSVQRGSTQFLSVAPGDPTTPGYPSKPGVPRMPVDGAIPSIPSIPISYIDAIPILKALNGHGPTPDDLNRFWQAKLGLRPAGVQYNIGPSPDNLVLNLINEQEYTTTPLWNVIGVMNGTLLDEVIILGNHRDAWVAGGAGDPNSGSAVLSEIVRSFGVAADKGWKPLRTIVFASWDGEEYGLIGSTEWVEEYLPWLTHTNVAYVNLDVAVNGPVFSASANPLLNKMLYEITSMMPSPNQTIPGQTVRDIWDGHIRTMGSGSDFTAFQDFAGIPSIDWGYGQDHRVEAPSAVYHYHSNYDSFYWMDNYGDPGFVYHETMAAMVALFTARLATQPLIPLNATDYATALEKYIQMTEYKLSQAISGVSTDEQDLEARARPLVKEIVGDINSLSLSFKKLHHAASKLLGAAIEHDKLSAKLAEEVSRDIPWWKWLSKARLYYRIHRVNSKYKFLDRNFLYQEGLDSRSWFKHVVFAPGLWTGYAGAVFPGLVEAIDNKDYENGEKWVGIIENSLLKAAKSLK